MPKTLLSDEKKAGFANPPQKAEGVNRPQENNQENKPKTILRERLAVSGTGYYLEK